MTLDEFVKYCRLSELYTGLPNAECVDLQGWNSDSPAFSRLIRDIKPKSIIEVGSWKGASAVHMIRLAQEQGLQTKLVCVDTWTGFASIYTDPAHRMYLDQVLAVGGRWKLLECFLNNVRLAGYEDNIFAFPATATDAARAFTQAGIWADLIYIDASHTKREVLENLSDFWPFVARGGALFGDDYDHVDWPDVVSAVNEFARTIDSTLDVVDRKYIIRKAALLR